MKSGLNPLSWLILLGAYLVLVFRSVSAAQYAWLLLALLVTLFVLRRSFRSILRRMGPILAFLPVMFSFYLVVSLILAETAFGETVRTIFISSARILLMVFGVASFLEFTSAMAILDSLRTLWRRLGLSWRAMEDLFQLLYLSLRFFPMLREEIQSISHLEKALGLPTARGRFNQVRRMGLSLPGLISNCLCRADNLAVAMETRRYGAVLPRGVANPVEFRLADAGLFFLLLLLVAGHTALAQL